MRGVARLTRRTVCCDGAAPGTKHPRVSTPGVAKPPVLRGFSLLAAQPTFAGSPARGSSRWPPDAPGGSQIAATDAEICHRVRESPRRSRLPTSCLQRPAKPRVLPARSPDLKKARRGAGPGSPHLTRGFVRMIALPGRDSQATGAVGADLQTNLQTGGPKWYPKPASDRE
jgi:hypothetical protein